MARNREKPGAEMPAKFKKLDEELHKKGWHYVDNFDDIHFGWYRSFYSGQIRLLISNGFADPDRQNTKSDLAVRIKKLTFGKEPENLFYGYAKPGEEIELIKTLIKHVRPL